MNTHLFSAAHLQARIIARRSAKLVVAISLSALSAAGNLLAADGDLDPSFNPGSGINAGTSVIGIALQSDGKIIIGGSFSFYNGTARSNIARINRDGSVDTTFNPGTGANRRVISIAPQPDGKIVIVGAFDTYNGVARHRIARLNSDGSLDLTFNPGSGPDDSASAVPPHAVLLQPDGKIIIGGGFVSYNGVARRGVARLNANGSLDASFDPGSGATDSVFGLALASDGKLIIGGSFRSFNGTERLGVARLLPSGALDTTFDPGQEIGESVRTVVLQPDGKVLVGGLDGLVRLNSNGSTDATFSKDQFAFVFACVVAADGKIIIGGNFASYNGVTSSNIARLNADGSVDATFNPGTGTDLNVFALAIQADGKIIIGGQFTTYNNTRRGGVARLLSSGGGPTPTPTPSATPTPSPTPTGPRPYQALPKGSLEATAFNVTPQGNVLRFTAVPRYSRVAASITVRVQASTTPNVAGSWQDLLNGSAGRMIRDYSTRSVEAFVLNSTHYPLLNGVHFRAITAASGYADSISNVVGPFNLASNTARAGTVALGSPDLIVSPGANIRFRAGVRDEPSGTAVRIQSSSTPSDEATWVDLRAMVLNAPGDYTLSTSEYQTNRSVYFRAIASVSGRVDSISNIIGDFDLKRLEKPTVTIFAPGPKSGGGSGRTADDPIVVGENQQLPITFTFSANATVNDGTAVRGIRLIYDGETVHRSDGNFATIQAQTLNAGDHVLRAIAHTTRYAFGAAPKVHIRIAPPGGRVFTCQGGAWTDASTWRDSQGNPGVPGPRDYAVIGTANVSLPQDKPDVTIAAVSLNGGSITGPKTLTVTNHFGLAAGQLRNLPLTIDTKGTLSLTADTDVAISGRLVNKGKFIKEGRGNIVGVPNGSGGTSFATLDNQGTFFLQGGGRLNFAATGSSLAGRIAALSLIGQDGAGVIGQDGAGVIGQDGAGVISTDGAGFITITFLSDAGSGILSENGLGLVSANGSVFVSNNGGSFVSNNGGSFISNNGGTLVFRPGSGAALKTPQDVAPAAVGDEPGVIMTGGEVDLGSPLSTSIQIEGNVTMEGGVLTGTGVLFGSLQQNGGFISPGASGGGAIGVMGDFTQGSGGTLTAEIGGSTPRQFDHLAVFGTANVNGKLNIRAIDGYAPEPDGTFSPLGYISGSGSFTTSANTQMTLGPTGLLGTLDAAAPPPPAPKLLNIATRMRVERGDDALIAGFIVLGNAPKKVLLRAIGPSLPVTGTLADPTLELVKASDGTSVFNNNWRDTQEDAIRATTIPPSNGLESAIVVTLEPGSYTAVMRGLVGGQPDGTGVGLVEVYDLDPAASSILANISTRGLVQTGDDVMIGGIIIGGTAPAKVLVRAIGSSLADQGVAGALQDPELELVDKNGNTISNDDWRGTQESEINDTTVPPPNDREAAIVATLVPDFYTAIVRGKGGTTGVALVEAYNLQ